MQFYSSLSELCWGSEEDLTNARFAIQEHFIEKLFVGEAFQSNLLFRFIHYDEKIIDLLIRLVPNVEHV